MARTLCFQAAQDDSDSDDEELQAIPSQLQESIGDADSDTLLGSSNLVNSHVAETIKGIP